MHPRFIIIDCLVFWLVEQVAIPMMFHGVIEKRGVCMRIGYAGCGIDLEH